MANTRPKKLDAVVYTAIDSATKERLSDAAGEVGTNISNLVRYGVELAIEAVKSGRYFDDLKKRRSDKA